jgi:hypothetical protein
MLNVFQRLIVAALCLLALALSLELLTHICPGAYLVPSVQAQDEGAPFVLKEEIYRYSTNPAGELFQQRIQARRSDGAEVDENNVGPMNSGLMIRNVTYTDGKTVSVIDSLQIKTTRPGFPEKWVGHMQALSRMQARGCVGGNEILMGRDNISGQYVVIVGPSPIPSPEGPDGLPWQITQWRAPNLGCQTLMYQMDKKRTDGSWQLMTKSKVVSLTVGEPDPQLFSDPSTYTELNTSDFQNRVLQKEGSPPAANRN